MGNTAPILNTTSIAAVKSIRSRSSFTLKMPIKGLAIIASRPL
jgi:hypothetical protein